MASLHSLSLLATATMATRRSSAILLQRLVRKNGSNEANIPLYGPINPGESRAPSSSTGGGGSHTHPVSITAALSGNFVAPGVQFAIPAMDIKHANVIVAAKD